MIYFMYSESGHVKIGYTFDIAESRIKALQPGCPYKLSILKVIDGGAVEEYAIHKLFEKYHFRGEWFIFNDDIKNFMDNPNYDNIYNKRITINEMSPKIYLNKDKILKLMIQHKVKTIGDFFYIAGVHVNDPYAFLKHDYKPIKLSDLYKIAMFYDTTVEYLTDNKVTIDDIKNYVPTIKKYMILEKDKRYPELSARKIYFKKDYKMIQYLRTAKKNKDLYIAVSCYLT